MDIKLLHFIDQCGVELWSTSDGKTTTVLRPLDSETLEAFNAQTDVVSVPFIKGVIECAKDAVARCRQDGGDVIVYLNEGKTKRLLDADLEVLRSDPELNFDVIREDNGSIYFPTE